MLRSNHLEVLTLIVCVLWGGAVILWLLEAQGAETASIADRISLITSAWMLPGLALAGISLLAQRWLGSESAVLFLGAVAGLTTLAAIWHLGRHPAAPARHDLAVAGFLVGATIALGLLRLAFFRDLMLPQYFDSATHYGLTRQYVEWAERTIPGRSIGLPVVPYYHVGYHVLMAGMASVLGLDIGALMLVSGQMILALTPVSLFALARRLTGSPVAAVVGVALAAAGWYMPAFAANWGKYPALFAVLPAVGAVTLGLQAVGWSGVHGARRRLWILGALLAATAGLLHTRSLAIVAAAVVAGVLARRVWILPTLTRKISVGFLALAMLSLMWSVWMKPSLRPAFEPYIGAGALPTLLVCVLAAVAFTYRPQIALAICMFLTYVLSGLLIPAPWPGFGSILDRPFVELWVFVPLSLLGGVGFAGLLPFLGSRGGKWAAVILTLALTWHAAIAYDLKASSCCTIVAPDDMVALHWLGSNLQDQDVVAIATEPEQLGPGRYQTLIAPVDAGAWVNALTGLPVVFLSSDADLGMAAVRDDMCRHGIRYIYVGGSSRGFDAETMRQQPGVFATRLLLPRASVVEIVGCD